MLSFVVVIILLLGSLGPQVIFAVPNQVDLDAYLQQIGWDQNEMETYLAEGYETELTVFDSLEDLQYFLGDFVSAKTIQTLLDN